MAQHYEIGIFSSLYRPSMGGVETYTAQLAKALVTKGNRVTVIACNTAGLPAFCREDDIEVVRLPCRPLLSGRYPIPRRNHACRSLWDNLGGRNFDFIIVNTRFYPLSVDALTFSQRRGIVPIVIEHGSAHLTLGNAALDKGVEFVEHALTTRCKKHPAVYYAVSKKSSAWLSHFGITSHGELPNSIDADVYRNSASDRNWKRELGVSPDDLLIAFVGRLVPEKGIMESIAALKTLEGNGVVAAFAGDGPLRGSLNDNRSPSIHPLGRLSQADTAALLSQADALCLPSRSEGFATTLLEAAACGTPALVTDVGGVDELIPDARFGTVLPNARPETIVDALRRAKQHQDQLKEQGENCRVRTQELYSWNATAEKVIEACRAAQPRRS